MVVCSISSYVLMEVEYLVQLEGVKYTKVKNLANGLFRSALMTSETIISSSSSMEKTV